MDKRFFPKIEAHLPVIIANEYGEKLNAYTLDTSSEGFRIQCTIEQRNMVTPGGSYIRNGRPVELLVSLDLPDNEGSYEKLIARCHIAFSRRVARNVCEIGIRYLDIEQDGYSKLVEFIEAANPANNCAMA